VRRCFFVVRRRRRPTQAVMPPSGRLPPGGLTRLAAARSQWEERSAWLAMKVGGTARCVEGRAALPCVVFVARGQHAVGTRRRLPLVRYGTYRRVVRRAWHSCVVIGCQAGTRWHACQTSFARMERERKGSIGSATIDRTACHRVPPGGRPARCSLRSQLAGFCLWKGGFLRRRPAGGPGGTLPSTGKSRRDASEASVEPDRRLRNEDAVGTPSRAENLPQPWPPNGRSERQNGRPGETG
jgi:hypothetical protein